MTAAAAAAGWTVTEEDRWTAEGQIKIQVHTSERVTFPVRDRGRDVGSYATIDERTDRFYLRTWATRNGRNFGAIPQGTWISKSETTLDQVKALAVKKIAAAGKRAQKNFGG